MNDCTLRQTAKDYDMSYNRVIIIYNNVGGNKLYEALEGYIEYRRNKHNNAEKY